MEKHVDQNLGEIGERHLGVPILDVHAILFILDSSLA